MLVGWVWRDDAVAWRRDAVAGEGKRWELRVPGFVGRGAERFGQCLRSLSLPSSRCVSARLWLSTRVFACVVKRARVAFSKYAIPWLKHELRS